MAQPGTKAQSTKARILDAAAKVFRARGYIGARLSDIAAEANTQSGSLYYHFASREDLVREVLQLAQRRTNDFTAGRVEELPSSATSMDRLRTALGAHLEAVLEISDYTAATLRILSEVPEEIRVDTVVLQRQYGRYWRQLFNDAQSDGYLRADVDLTAARPLILGAMNFTPEWFGVEKHGLTLGGVLEHLEAVFLQGLATPLGREHFLGNPEVVHADKLAILSGTGTRAAATLDRIMDASAKVFRERGYAGTRLVDVATEAEMKTGSLYYHLDSREDLVAAFLNVAWNRLNQTLRTSVDALDTIDATPINRLAAAIATLAQGVSDESDYTAAMVRISRQVPEEILAAVQPFQRTYIQSWRRLLDDSVDAGEVRADLSPVAVIMLLIGSLNWSVEWYSRDVHSTPDRLTRIFCDMAFFGIAAKPPAQ